MNFIKGKSQVVLPSTSAGRCSRQDALSTWAQPDPNLGPETNVRLLHLRVSVAGPCGQASGKSKRTDDHTWEERDCCRRPS